MRQRFLIPLLLNLILVSPAFSSSPLIRIGILLKQSQVRIGASPVRKSSLNGSRGEFKIIDPKNNKLLAEGNLKDCWLIQPNSLGLKIGGKGIGSEEIIILSSNSSTLLVNQRPYRGKIEIRKNNQGSLTVINELNIEEYLYGIMKMEISPSWPEEAQMAQAVVARTYALSNLGKYQLEGFDLTSTDKDQVYAGIYGEDPRSNQAVDKTYGQLLTFEGELAKTFFHADSGGWTEDIQNVWGETIAYLKSVPSRSALDSPYREWRLEFKAEDFREILRKNGLKVGKIYQILPLKITPAGRITLLKVCHSEGELKISGSKLRSILGTSKLRSTLFKVNLSGGRDEEIISSLFSKGVMLSSKEGGKEVTLNGIVLLSAEEKVKGEDKVSALTIVKIPATIKFSGKGWGHGVGMSQWGAKGLAEQGYTYQQILEHYYPGTRLERWY